MRAARSFFLVIGGSAIFFGIAVFVTPNFEAYAGTTAIGPFDAALIDGDTLSDGNINYRLVGVDACEMGQPIDFVEEPETLDCGYYAKKFMEQFIADDQIICYDQGSRSYERVVARCFRHNGTNQRLIEDDLGAFALRSGWAVSTDHAEGMFAFRYFYEELIAKTSLRGAWNGTSITPAKCLTFPAPAALSQPFAECRDP